MSGVKKEGLIMMDGIVLFERGVCVIVKNSRNEEKCIWFKCTSDPKLGMIDARSNAQRNDNVKYLAKGLKFKEKTDMVSAVLKPIKVEAINIYKDGLCVDITENNVIWFIDRSKDPILEIKDFDYIKNNIYNDAEMDVSEIYGKHLTSLPDDQVLGGYRKTKSTKKRRKNTRRKNTRRKNTRRKNTKRKNTKRKKTRRKKTRRL